MSYESYAKSEMAWVKTPSHVQKQVLALLVIVGDQGHSGGSMGVFGPAMCQWAMNPVDITDRADLRYGMSEFLKDYSFEDRKTILEITAKVMRFKPLSLLTGADDEWNVCHGEDHYQNRRMSSIFKDGKDGKAYWIDGYVFAHPYSDYTGWSGWTRGGGASRKTIEFPYDAETSSTYVYHSDSGMTRLIPEGIDANVWLKWQRDIYQSGIDPVTNKVREDAMFYSSETSVEFLSHYAGLMISVEKFDDETKQDMITRLGWVNEDMTFSYAYHDPILGEITQQIKNSKLAAKLIRLVQLTPVGYKGTYLKPGYDNGEILEDPEGQRFTVTCDFVQYPTKFYGGWDTYRIPCETGGTEPAMVAKLVPFSEVSEVPGMFYYDKPYQITEDPDHWLRIKRREYGYAHPNRKVHRVTIASDSTDPVGEVNAIVDAFHGAVEGTEPPKPEYDQNASQGIGDDIGKALK